MMSPIVHQRRPLILDIPGARLYFTAGFGDKKGGPKDGRGKALPG
jgi:hypothetical protein